MKLLDRATGGCVGDLPSPVMPGRYCLLEPQVFNGHSELHAGDLLPDDGSGVVRIAGQESNVAPIDQADEEQAEAELSAEAIIAIAEKISHENREGVSPMLPSEMAAQCELDQLERTLAAVLREGHLQSISERPRRDLRYDDSISPVARARRLATTALSHLASHSDCWQQRTLCGVQPRKILSRFSEDDFAIYENRLYKRLLDRLDRHLAKRLGRIRALNSRIDEYHRFRLNQNLHHRLYHDICSLWGQAFQNQQSSSNSTQGDEDKKSEKTPEQQLEDQLRSIRSLKCRGLYKCVPPSAVVPAQVHRTNILNHDPHYRHLPALWEKLKDEREDRQLAPDERLAKHQQLQLAYENYVGLVLRRAIERYGLRDAEGKSTLQWAGQIISLKHVAHDWVVEYGQASLTFIPIVWFGADILNGATSEPGRILCWPGTAASVASSQTMPVSPLDLYVVEKMGHLIDEWIVRQLLEGYGRKLGPLPTTVKRLTETWPDHFETVSPTHVRLISPLDEQQSAELKASLRASANSQVEVMVGSAIEQIGALAQLCGHSARFIPNPQRDFYCQCGSCNTTWSLKTSGKTRLFSMMPKGASSIPSGEGFVWSGRDWLNFEFKSHSL